jgi:hypothetical protein
VLPCGAQRGKHKQSVLLKFVYAASRAFGRTFLYACFSLLAAGGSKKRTKVLCMWRLCVLKKVVKKRMWRKYAGMRKAGVWHVYKRCQSGFAWNSFSSSMAWQTWPWEILFNTALRVPVYVQLFYPRIRMASASIIVVSLTELFSSSEK